MNSNNYVQYIHAGNQLSMTCPGVCCNIFFSFTLHVVRNCFDFFGFFLYILFNLRCFVKNYVRLVILVFA